MSQSTQLANAKREKGREHEIKRKRERGRKEVLLESQLQRRTRNVRVPFSLFLLFLSSSFLFRSREKKNLFNTVCQSARGSRRGQRARSHDHTHISHQKELKWSSMSQRGAQEELKFSCMIQRSCSDCA